MCASLFEHADRQQGDSMQVRAIANTARDKACGIALGTIEAIAFEVQCERFTQHIGERPSPFLSRHPESFPGIPSMVTKSTAHLL